MKFLKRFLVGLVATVICFSASASTCFAAKKLSEDDLFFYGMNGIYFFMPGNKNTCGYGTMTGSTLYEKVLSYLLSLGLNEVAAAGVYGNMLVEGLGSGALLRHEEGVNERSDIHTWYKAATYYGSNGLYVEEKDVRALEDPSVMHGLGFIQWSFERRVNLLHALRDAGGLDKYATAWDDTAGKYVYDRMTYDELVGELGQETTDAILMAELEFFNSEHEGIKVTSGDIADQGLGKYGISAGMLLYDALNMVKSPYEAAELFYSTSEMPGATKFSSSQTIRGDKAIEGYNLITETGLTSEGATTCNNGNNGDIVSTALALAWDRATEGKHDKSDPKPEYETAMHEVGTWYQSGPCGSGGCAPNGASCDIFVSTVMRYSGVDPDYPEYGPWIQRDHMASHPDMYEEIENLGNSSNLQAGDIFVGGNGHILIFMGVVDGKWMQASASFNQRTGEYFTYEEYGQSGKPYQIFRRI